MSQGRAPAKVDLLHRPHENGDGLLLVDAERISHLRQALLLILTECDDHEHAKIIAHTALRLDAAGAAYPKGHLQRFMEGAGTRTERRLRRFLSAEPTSKVTAVGRLVRKVVEAQVYEGIVGREALDELTVTLPKEEVSRGRELLGDFVAKWNRRAILFTEILCDGCEALIREGQFQLRAEPLPPVTQDEEDS